MKDFSKFLVLCAVVVVGLVMVATVPDTASTVLATKDMYKIAKDKFGKEIKGCKHCHVKALPKETSHDLNEVGEWLVEQKEERGAEAVDPAWLEDYPSPG